MTCNVSPLDFANLLLGLLFQQERHAVYHVKSHQYHLQKEGRKYVLNSSVVTSSPPQTNTTTTHHVINTQTTLLCLIRPLKLENITNPAPPKVFPLLHEFAKVFHPPTGLPSCQNIAHYIDLIQSTTLPNASAYHLAPKEATEIERKIHQLLYFGHIQPSSSPCASSTFIIPKKDTSECHLVTD